MTKEEWNCIKNQVIRINKELDKYNGTPVFQKKVELAKEMLAKYPLPKEIYDYDGIAK